MDEKRNYWKEEEENLLRDWADKAQCYELLHAKSHAVYKTRHTWFVIPVIIISTVLVLLISPKIKLLMKKIKILTVFNLQLFVD